MNDQVEQSEATAEKAPREIIRGRMPVAIVALARFGDTKDLSVSEQAAKFGTTVGKIDDIRKNRNFTYVDANFHPTQEMVDAGVEYLKKHPQYDEQEVDTLVNELTTMPLATEEEAATFAATRKAARGQSEKTKDGETANAGGGNRRGKKNAEPSGEDLLS